VDLEATGAEKAAEEVSETEIAVIAPDSAADRHTLFKQPSSHISYEKGNQNREKAPREEHKKKE